LVVSFVYDNKSPTSCMPKLSNAGDMIEKKNEQISVDQQR